MNAVELTGFAGFGSDAGTPSGAANQSTNSTVADPVPSQILDFWPITFARQIGVMCKFASSPPSQHLSWVGRS